jgi:hypothetical protein
MLDKGGGGEVPVELSARHYALVVQPEVRDPVGQRKIPFSQ